MSKERILELEEQVRYHSDLYYNKGEGEHPDALSDADFDALLDELRVLAPDSTALIEVGAVPTYGKKVSHGRVMGSLDKVHTVEELLEWQAKHGGDIVMAPKVDGLAVRLNYEDGQLVEAATRGTGKVGQDITDNVKAIQSIPNEIPGFTGEVRGEIYMKKSTWKEIGGFANPRNAASGSACQKDPNVTAQRDLQLLCYDIETDEGVLWSGLLEFLTETEKIHKLVSMPGLTPVSMWVFPPDKLDELASRLFDWENVKRQELDYQIDGMVFSLADIEAQEEAGMSGKNPNGRVAFKFKPEQKTTRVVSVDLQTGRTGRLTPMARLEPVFVDGSTISNVTLHNYARAVELQIQAGDEVIIEKAGDIIPQLVRNLSKDGSRIWEGVPASCPACNQRSELDEQHIGLWCRNFQCPGKLEERVYHFLKTLDVLGVGRGIVSGLCRNGFVKEFSDLYYLSVRSISAVTGGESSAQNAYEAILSKNEIPLWQFLASLGIPNFGRTVGKDVAKTLKTLQAVRGAGVGTLEKIEGIGPTVATNIVEGLLGLSETIEKLLQCIDVLDVVEASGPLVGMTFCITGSLSKNKKLVGADIEKAGGEMKSSVGKGLTYLVMADVNSTSSKAQKARKFGTICIDEQELRRMINAP